MSQDRFEDFQMAEEFTLKDGKKGQLVRERISGKIAHAFLEGQLIPKSILPSLFGQIMEDCVDDLIFSRTILHDLKKVAPILKRLDEDLQRLNNDTQNLAKDINLVRQILDSAFLRELGKRREKGGDEIKKS